MSFLQDCLLSELPSNLHTSVEKQREANIYNYNILLVLKEGKVVVCLA